MEGEVAGVISNGMSVVSLRSDSSKSKLSLSGVLGSQPVCCIGMLASSVFCLVIGGKSSGIIGFIRLRLSLDSVSSSIELRLSVRRVGIGGVLAR